MKRCSNCDRTYDDTVTVCPEDGAPLEHLASTLSHGAVIRGKYRIVAELGRGGMASVYRAQHIHFGEDKALKVLLNSTDSLQRDALRAEAVLLRSLKHPYIVQVEDIDQTESGELFVAMELIEGENLSAFLTRNGPLPSKEALQIAAAVCEALRFSHSKGVLHRDIKPHNILLQTQADGTRTPKVIDFGIAKVKEEAQLAVPGMLTSHTGYFLGTPEYASPEQVMGMKGADLDGRTDIYSLGLVLYQAVTGRLPFAAESVMSRLFARLQTEPVPPGIARPDLDIGADVSALIMKALEKDRQRRFSSADQMREAIEETLRRKQPVIAASPATRPSPAGQITERSQTGSLNPASPARSRWILWISVASALVAIALAIGFWQRGFAFSSLSESAAEIKKAKEIAQEPGTTTAARLRQELPGKWIGQHVLEGRFTDGDQGQFKSVIESAFEVEQTNEGLTAIYTDRSVITRADGKGAFVEEWQLMLNIEQQAQELIGSVQSASYRTNGGDWISAPTAPISFHATLQNDGIVYVIVLKTSPDGKELTGRRGTFRRPENVSDK